MILSIVIVISGVVCSCIPLWRHPDSPPDGVIDLLLPGFTPLLGILFVLLSAAMAAGRAVLEEIIMAENGGLAPVTLATVSCTLSTALLLLVLLLAQLFPGLDHGVQVLPARRRRKKPAH